MREYYTKRQIEEIYHCGITKENGRLKAIGKPVEGIWLFDFVEGDTLDELHGHIRDEIARAVL